MTTWRTIESAPTDGTWVLLKGGEINYGWDGETQPPVVVAQGGVNYLNGGTQYWQFAWYDGGYYGEYENPTHWAPVP